jgi:pimeloyl-ACP methyl ester carboxylesterase
MNLELLEPIAHLPHQDNAVNNPKGKHVDLAEQRFAPEQQTTARFMSRTGVKVISAALQVTARISPRAGAQLGYRILSQPPKFKTPAREKPCYDNARHTRIPFGRGHLKVLDWGDGPAVLLVHCWGGRATQFFELSDQLVSKGFRVLSFDGPAHGESAGKRTDMFQFSEAIATVAQQFAPLHGVVAHSFGAAMTLMAHRDLGLSAERFALIAGFKSCNWFMDAFGQFFCVPASLISQMKRDLDARLGQSVDWDGLSMVDMIGRVNHPILLIHDREDQEVPFAHAQLLHQSSQRAELLETQGLGHRRILRDPLVISKTVDFIGNQSLGAEQ